MKISKFKSGYKSGRELNIDLGRLTIRIARFQFAIWWDYDTIVNWVW